MYDEMSETPTHTRKSRNPTRVPWHLRGREARVAELRESQNLTFDEIGLVVGCSGEGARQAYNRFLKQKSPPSCAPEPSEGGPSVESGLAETLEAA